MVEKKRRAWPAILARIAICALGALVVLVGARNGWEKTSSTTVLLVVGLLLIALGVLWSPDLQEFSGRYKDAQVNWRRGRDLNFADAVRRVGGQVPDDEVRARLNQLADEIATTLPNEETPRPHRQGFWKRVRETFEEPQQTVLEPETDAESDEARRAYFERIRAGYLLGQVDATAPDVQYLFQVKALDDPPTAQIYATFRWWGDWRIRCDVRTPDGAEVEEIIIGSVYMQGNNFYVNFPEDFEGAPPLEAGEYVFTWRHVPPQRYVVPALRRDTVTVRPDQAQAPGQEEWDRSLEVRTETYPIDV